MVGERLLFGLGASVAIAAVASAQQAGSIRGVVLDKDFDAPLPGAEVQVVETGQRVLTNDQGGFVLSQVAPGKYTLVIAKDGYTRHVRADLVVSAGQLTEVSASLAGDFTELEEFVVQDVLQLGVGTEAALLDLRLESPSFLDSIGTDLMSRAGASDATEALRLVSGASVQNGKSAVIRGLPDRYVSSQLNGVRLPSADEDKRAVELDQFPSEVISSLQVSKTFTPDQQGDASGGAVNVLLKGVPEEPFFVKWKIGTSHNTQVSGRNRFLSYQGGGVHAFGKSGSERAVQELGENWDGSVGVSREEAPIDYKMSGAIGGQFEIARGVRLGGMVSLYYERDSAFHEGVDNSLWAVRLGDPLTPQFSQGTPSSGEFYTSLLDVTQGSQSVQWGGLSTFGIASEHHSVTLTHLFTRNAEDVATLAEDTRGKQYFFPGHDPDVETSPGSEQFLGAPYLRLQTLEYTERATSTLQLGGRHELPVGGRGPLRSVDLDWVWARSNATRDQPDKRQFASAWSPTGTYVQYKPAAQFTLGNLQRIYKKIEEDSEQVAVNLKLPFEVWGAQKGYFKAGTFRDRVDRKFDQDTFSNFSDPSFYSGRFDEIDWSQAWIFEDHAITESKADIDYDGQQVVTAQYLMLDLPIAGGLRVIGGMRFESTRLNIVNHPEEDAVWVPPGQFGTADLLPGDADVNYRRSDDLGSVGIVYEPLDGLTLRGAYNETVARQTFKEITPIAQQEYLGGPVFVGNPDLEMSSLRNYDARVDYVPYTGGLFSVSWFKKDIKKPIEYVEKLAGFTYTTAVNYPRGTLSGFEAETRQDLGHFVDPLHGLSVGANATWIDATVRLPNDEIVLFESVHSVAPKPTRDMTNAPDYLYNLFLTYDLQATGTGLAAFYTVQGDTLVSGPGPSNDFFVPATYLTAYDSLNVTVTQSLGAHVKLTLAAKNLTNAERREVYRSEFISEDVTRTSYTTGVEYSLSIGGEIRF
ncbi:MAG TPA: TonB-dependent receptor [Planctomycetota bacterium]|nr:TonB-dependent receptor [Planctomycetota bacterium]